MRMRTAFTKWADATLTATRRDNRPGRICLKIKSPYTHGYIPLELTEQEAITLTNKIADIIEAPAK